MRGPIKNFHTHVITSIIAVVAALAMLLLFLAGSGGLPSFGSSYHVRAIVPTSASVAPQSDVTIAGVGVGHVVSVQRDGDAALLDLAIDSKHSPIPVDSRVAVRLRTLVGEKYVQITPGLSRRMLPSGGVLPMSQADDYVDIDQILTQLSGTTQLRAREAIQGLGGALTGKGAQLNQLLEGAAATITQGAPVVHTLAHDHVQVASLISNLGQIAQQVGERSQALRTLGQQMTLTFGAVAARDGALRAVLHALPPTLRQVRTTSGVLSSTSTIAAPVLARLATAVSDLAPAVRILRPAAQQARQVIGALGAASPALQQTLGALQRASAPASSALPTLRTMLCQADPAIRYVAPYANELAATITGLGSAVNAYDANGHIARLYIGVGSDSLFGGTPPDVAKAEQTLLSSGLLAQYHMLGYDPYPPAGGADNTTIGRTTTGPQDSTQPYPHVQADC
jgi:phospholipid/cholesterol/gamma-HCH transport system substrate-binding protein